MLRDICYPTPSFYLPSPGCFKGWMWLKNLPWIKHYQYSNYIEVVEISVFWITRSWWNNRQWIWVTLQQLLLLLNRILFCFWKVINLSVSSRSYCHSVTARSQVPSQLDSHSVSCQSISQSISLSVSQSIKQSRSQAVSQSASQSVSQSSQSVSHSVICQSVSNQLVTSQSVSQSVNELEKQWHVISQSVFGCVDDNHTDCNNHLGMERSKYNPATQHKTNKQQRHTNKESEYTWSGSF